MQPTLNSININCSKQTWPYVKKKQLQWMTQTVKLSRKWST